MSTERAVENLPAAAGLPAEATIDQLLREGARRLAGLGGSPRLDAELLLAHALGQRREHLYQALFSQVPAGTVEIYGGLLAARAARQPVAQLVGQKEFWSLPLDVTRATLVPRPETELLVERALAHIPAGAAQRVADLGTGTGAVALAIARERPACRVTATDLSKPALAVARRNARQLGITNVTFHQGDWFRALPKGRFHVLVSNPPYIAAGEWPDTDPELGFEPRLALAAGRDGLDALRVIAGGAGRRLEAGGWLLVEHGMHQDTSVRRLLKAGGFRGIATTPDLSGRPRVTEGQWQGGTDGAR
jgi:release factor glutamine methyltransferase